MGKYISIEKLIEQSKESYYEALQLSSQGWHQGENDYLPFVLYSLGIVAAAYRDFSARVQTLSLSGLSKPERVRELLKGSLNKMTKADIVNEISRTTGIEKAAVQTTVEAFMEAIKGSVIDGKNVYLRGFGSFVVKKRAEKTARNISKNVTIKIPEHFIPSFKPSKSFVNQVKDQVK